jgi:hypothetical protein
VSAQRLFTANEANATLPLVRRIVTDILEQGQTARAAAESTIDNPEAERVVQEAVCELRNLFDELESIGCSYRDWNFEIGLVDFPAKVDGEDVLLCWRSDEPSVAHYHGVHAGYAGRKPILDEPA